MLKKDRQIIALGVITSPLIIPGIICLIYTIWRIGEDGFKFFTQTDNTIKDKS